MARNKLPASMTQKCTRCKHGKAAHKDACKMKHCKCEGFKA
jgi:hypothetical protein